MKVKQLNHTLPAALLLLGAGALGAAAQTSNPSEPLPQSPPSIENRTLIRSDAGLMPVIPSMFEPVVAAWILNNSLLVKNQPVGAVFESETSRIGADGVTLVTRMTTRIYRDSQGRTRREQAVVGQSAPASITINDPVAGYSYSLNETTRTALRYRLSKATPAPHAFPFGEPGAAPPTPNAIEVLRNVDPQNGLVMRYRLGAPRVEQLGKRQINDVEVEGRRLTVRVPAGAVTGDANDTESVYETWFARDLRMLLQASASNPAFGDHKLRPVTISRSEQPSSLFAVPAGYAVQEMGVVMTDSPAPPPN